ncbi:uncharacterized protein LOC120351426 [Nilaparvata lugens]|uniref:uncharacterized protein LOC120351426 n=1 Tax=Nilaparvata lugens TaxID=108931 RepID=UPI00193D1DAA|nr:uncharacterized protein LOC120351426 [Nilaparvata lugens]
MSLILTVLCTIILILFVIIEGIAAMNFMALLGKSTSSTKTIDSEEFNGEIDYKLPKNFLFGEKISFNKFATTFRVGRAWKKSIGSKGDTAKCTRLMGNQYKDEFRTGIALLCSDKLIELKNEEFYNYFVLTDREVWKCVNKDGVSPSFSFYRVVNVMQGNYGIYKLYYFDGIEVVRKFNLPALDSAVLHTPVTAVLREVKYLQLNDLKQLKYEGSMEYYFPNDGPTNHKLSMFETVFLNEEHNVHLPNEKWSYYYIDIAEWLEKQDFRVSEIGTNGGVLRIGQTWYDEIGSQGDEATCIRILNDDRLHTSTLLPECQLWTVDPKLLLVRNKNNEFKNYDIPILAEYFTVTRHEFWDCEIENSTKKFSRIVTELIGRKPIRKVEHYDGISVWKYSMNGNDDSVKIRSIHYCRPDQMDQYIKFSGVLHLINQDENRDEADAIEYTVEYEAKNNKIKDYSS